VARDYGNTANELLGERTFRLEIQVQSKLVKDVDVRNVGKRRCLKRGRSIQVDETVLHIPRRYRTTILPMIATIQ